jgi:hypothetical protein
MYRDLDGPGHGRTKANQPLLRDPDEIYPGQTLRIPQ